MRAARGVEIYFRPYYVLFKAQIDEMKFLNTAGHRSSLSARNLSLFSFSNANRFAFLEDSKLYPTSLNEITHQPKKKTKRKALYTRTTITEI